LIYIIVGGAIGFLYLYLIVKFVEISIAYLEKKGVKDHCLKVLPSLFVIIITSLILGFFLPQPINKFSESFAFSLISVA
jgi:hypothetical protein